MHPNRKFQVSDQAAMVDFVREHGFGTLVARTADGLRAVHLPVLVDGDRVRFHVAKANLVHDALLDGADVLVVVNGPHGYVSPDDYGLEDRVPTWNYVAVELGGRVTALDPGGLVRLLDEISDQQEAKLAPKAVWKRDKMSEGRFNGLLKAITGFELRVTEWRGTFKLDQDKPAEIRSRLVSALEARGEAALARLMKP